MIVVRVLGIISKKTKRKVKGKKRNIQKNKYKWHLIKFSKFK